MTLTSLLSGSIVLQAANNTTTNGGGSGGGEVIVIGALCLVGGVLFAFFGARILEMSAFIIGALIGLILGGLLGWFLGPLLGIAPYVCGAVGALTGVMVGGYMALQLVQFLIMLGVSGAGAYLTFLLVGPSWGVVLLAFVILFVITYLLYDRVLMILMAFLGGALGGIGTFFLSEGSIGGAAVAAAVAVAAALAILGAFYQIRGGFGPPPSARYGSWM